MAKKSNPILDSGLILPLSFLVLFSVNVLVVYLANLLFPQAVALGTYALTPAWSLFHSMLLLSLINVFFIPVVHYHEIVRSRMYTPKDWLLVYFVLNFVGIWLLARLAHNFGFGISAWWVALLLAAALDWLQGLAMMALTKLTE